MPRVFLAAIVVVACASQTISHASAETRRVLYKPAPEYPAKAREQHLSGRGLFALRILPGGAVARVDTLNSIGHRSLDAAAIAAFRQWRFARYDAPWTLRVPIRYVDGTPRIDEAMRRRPAPGYTPLITLFSRRK
jgi:TonB family protein